MNRDLNSKPKYDRLLRSYQIVFMVLVSYGLLYFSLQYRTYELTGHDFVAYSSMYRSPLDFERAPAPFVYRQFTAVITNLIYRSGVNYPGVISFSHPDIDQRLFVSAVLSNYLALVLTAVIVSMIVNRKLGRVVLFAPLVGGSLCFLQYFAQKHVIAAQADGWSWFLIAAAYYGYVTRRLAIVFAAFLLSIFQREILPLVFLALAGFDFFYKLSERRARGRFYLHVAIGSVISFSGYLLIRMIFIPVAGYDHQLELNFLSKVLGAFPPPDGRFLSQSVSHNVVFILVATTMLLYLVRRKEGRAMEAHRSGYELFRIMFVVLVIEVIFVGSAGHAGAGRFDAMITPIVAVAIATHLAEIEDLAALSHKEIRKPPT